MKENNKQTNGSLTQISTTYARICVILLALNFCLTGYVLSGALKLQQEAGEVQSSAATTTTRQAVTTTTPQAGTTASTESTPVDPSEEVKTLEKE